MKTTFDYLDKLTEPEGVRVFDLLDAAFNDEAYSSNTRNAFFRGYKSESPNVVLLHSNRELAGVAVLGTRDIQFAGAQVKALTIGPLAIHPRFQKRGFSNLLMGGIDDLAVALGAQVAYLQGTPGFYHRFGYYPLLARTKVSLNVDAIRVSSRVEVHPFSERYLSEIMGLFAINAAMYSCASKRSEGDWEWLTRHACDTYYFYRPQVVTEGGRVVGYFCSDAREPGRIREAVHGTESEETGLFLSGLKMYAGGGHPKILEIMTPANSPLHGYLRRGIDATFTEFMQSNGGQLMKVFDLELICNLDQAATAHRCSGDMRAILTSVVPISSDHSAHATSDGLGVEHIPGILSGFIARMRTPTEATWTDARSVCAETQSPFIYQGDNY